MMNIFKSLFVIVAVAAVAGGATYSYFSDTETVAGMTFGTGKLEITDTSAGWSKTVKFENLKPGQTVRKWVTLENTGNLDVDTLTVKAVAENNTSGLLNEIKVSATGKVGEGEAAYFTPDWTGGAKINPWFFATNGADMLDNSYYRTAAGVIKPGESYTMSFDFTVPADLDNKWQGKSASFDMVFYAEQAH